MGCALRQTQEREIDMDTQLQLEITTTARLEALERVVSLLATQAEPGKKINTRYVGPPLFETHGAKELFQKAYEAAMERLLMP